MLIQFTVGNYKTFKEKATLSLVASNYDKETRAEENIMVNEKFNLRLLKSAVIYGANASGKSKLIEALQFMQWMMLNSFKETQIGEKINVHPFKLQTDYDTMPSFFQIMFIYDKKIFRYGFEATANHIDIEWLYLRGLKKEITIFERKSDNYYFHPVQFKIGKLLQKENFIRNNALVLSTAAQFNDKMGTDILNSMRNFRFISHFNDEGTENYTKGQIANPEKKAKILNFIKDADLNIEDISIRETNNFFTAPKYSQKSANTPDKNIETSLNTIFTEVRTVHKKYNELRRHTESIDFSMENDESAGTRKFFYLAGPILDSLENGYTLIADELDSRLHPNLVCKIAELFNSSIANPLNAQLIFNTHNTNLLSSGIFRRDQIWFTEKNRYGAVKLFSLSDIKVRRTDKYEEDYIEGRYGAIPYLAYFNERLAADRM